MEEKKKWQIPSVNLLPFNEWDVITASPTLDNLDEYFSGKGEYEDWF